MFGDDKSGNNNGSGGGIFSKKPGPTQSVKPNQSDVNPAVKIGIFRPKLPDMQNALKVFPSILRKIW